MDDLNALAGELEMHMAVHHPLTLAEMTTTFCAASPCIAPAMVAQALARLTSTGRAIACHSLVGATRYRLPEPAAPVDVTVFTPGLDVPAFLAKQAAR